MHRDMYCATSVTKTNTPTQVYVYRGEEKQNILNHKSTQSKQWECGMLNSKAAYTLLCPPPPPRNRFPWHTDVIDNHAKEQRQANRRNHPRTPQIRIHVALIEPDQ